MNIVFGFGSSEGSYREKVKRDIELLCVECLNGRFENLDDVWFTEDILKDIEIKVKQYAEQTRTNEKKIAEKEIKDRPERYSYVYINFAGDGSNLFFGIDFSHINSRHPMSPDGMAMMSIRDSMWIKSWDFQDGILEIELSKTTPSTQELDNIKSNKE